MGILDSFKKNDPEEIKSSQEDTGSTQKMDGEPNFVTDILRGADKLFKESNSLLSMAESTMPEDSEPLSAEEINEEMNNTRGSFKGRILDIDTSQRIDELLQVTRNLKTDFEGIENSNQFPLRLERETMDKLHKAKSDREKLLKIQKDYLKEYEKRAKNEGQPA